MPLLVHLADCVRGIHTPVETIARAAIKALEHHDVPAPGLAATLSSRLSQQSFRLLVDGGEDFGAAARPEAIRTLTEFQRGAAVGHEIFLTADEATFDPAHYLDGTVALVIQPMAPERVSLCLKDQYPDVAEALLLKLRETSLFDLAGIPWLLSRMIEHHRQGVEIRSRTGVLERFAREGLATVGGPTGTRARVEDALMRLGWRLQSTRQNSLPAPETYQILGDVRGHRDFPLEGFLEQILESRLLVKTGDEDVRFAYPGLQSYYCARYLMAAPERARALHLEDITASLGRQFRVRWWHDTLVILAGLLDHVDPLLRMILAGSPLSQGEQIFVAAQCLHEARQAGRSDAVGRDILDQIVDALVWQSRPESGGGTSVRRKSLEALSLLREPRAIPHVIPLVIERVRRNWEGTLTYDYSSVRQAALHTLIAMQGETLAHVKNDPVLSQHPLLPRLLESWLAGDVDTLSTLLESGDPRVAAVTAFALGTFKTPHCLELLIQRYRSLASRPDQGDVLWAITETLSVFDPVQVTEHAIRPLLSEPSLTTSLAYLIGRLGIATTDSDEMKFLRQCMQSDDVILQGRALRSYAALLSVQSGASVKDDVEGLRAVCHDLIQDKFAAGAGRSLVRIQPDLRPEMRWQLRYQALEALRSIGNERSIEVLRSLWRRTDARTRAIDTAEPPTPGSSPDMTEDLIDRLSFQMAEDIYWRLTGGLSAETYRPLASSDEANRLGR